jgi:Na+/H+ antiporter NhaD/arsenite permease-like protein
MSETLMTAALYETAVPAAVPLLDLQAQLPPFWLVTPFILLLLMIATGPLLYQRFWEEHYSRVSVLSGVFVMAYYAFATKRGPAILWHTLEEYISFIALTVALFIAAGGILIRIERRGSPFVNGALLLFGALIANLIGTTGASMLLIRPWLRINEGRIKAYHIVFFIFIVSNIGGALTPIGDPPLFLGFLKGVPFFWAFSKLWLPWLLTVTLLIVLFMVFDTLAGEGSISEQKQGGGVKIAGSKNFLYLALVIGSVFIDPLVLPAIPSLQHLFHLPFGMREVIMFALAALAWKSADKEVLKENEFNFLPISEVAYLFIGIFFTMIPALELIAYSAATHADVLSVTRFFWMTGLLSGVLDNAPTYLNFLAGALGKFGLSIGSISDVRAFAKGVSSPVPGDAPSDIYLMAISLASVFFGSMSYIGNAPNFMVRKIAEQRDVAVPGFVEYIYKYSLPLLMPIFILLWWLFCNY